MISWITSWAQGIIVAVIVATIIEMILPQSSIKKYVKVVIGVYVVFSIISPVVKAVSKGNIDFNEIIDTSAYEEEMEKSNNKISEKLASNNNKTIKDIYLENLESDIKNKLQKKGYGTTSIYIKAQDDENYTIEEIILSVYKQKDNENKTKENIINNIKINEINISTNTEISNTENSNKLNDNTKNELKEYLSEEYSVSVDIIQIN